MSATGSERLFVGAEPEVVLRRHLVALAAAQVEALPEAWRAIQAEDLHLTLCFIGAMRTGPGVGPDRAEIEQDLVGLCRRLGPATAEFAGLEFWPQARARLAVATLRADTALRSLAQGCRLLAQGWGVPQDARPFRPHLTLARGPALAATFAASNPLDLPPMQIDHLCLYRTRPRHRPRYEVVWRGALAGAR